MLWRFLLSLKGVDNFRSTVVINQIRQFIISNRPEVQIVILLTALFAQLVIAVNTGIASGTVKTKMEMVMTC